MKSQVRHGYSGRSLAQKLGLKPGSRLFHKAAPTNYSALLSDVWDKVEVLSRSVSGADLVHVFCEDATALERCASDVAPKLARGSCLWVSWRKNSSQANATVNREIVRSRMLKTGLVDIKVCAIDQDWSGLKFVHRRQGNQ